VQGTHSESASSYPIGGKERGSMLSRAAFVICVKNALTVRLEWRLRTVRPGSTARLQIRRRTIEGVVTSWNRGAERIFGDPEQEMLGQSIFRLACVDGEKNMIAVLHQICRGERADHYETMRRRKDGTEIAMSLTVSPVRNSSGEIVGASRIARDISARRKGFASR
jgi:PAS domain S-box-containing protein